MGGSLFLSAAPPPPRGQELTEPPAPAARRPSFVPGAEMVPTPMQNAAIYLHPNGYDTQTKTLMGRHSAGESFLRGFLRHAEVDQHIFWNVAGRPLDELLALVQRIHPSPKPRGWINMRDRRALGGKSVV